MKYWAFLSYSHTDRKWGDWLHKSLETYRVPRRLIGKESRDGNIPARLYPIFRDREELPVSADLGSNINEALRESRYLIVICSPRAAQSRWVGEEIKAFKRLGREDRILALIIDGEPNASDGKPGFVSADECFPEPMRYRLDADGQFSSERTEAIAADARKGKDGKNNAKLKLLAGLLGVNYDDLRRREQERRLRRARLVVTSALILIGAFAALSVALFFKEREARSLQRQAEQARDEAGVQRVTAEKARDEARTRLSDSYFERALGLLESGDRRQGVANLIASLRTDPGNEYAADRLLFELNYGDWLVARAYVPLPPELSSSSPTFEETPVLHARLLENGQELEATTLDYSRRPARVFRTALKHPDWRLVSDSRKRLEPGASSDRSNAHYYAEEGTEHLDLAPAEADALLKKLKPLSEDADFGTTYFSEDKKWAAVITLEEKALAECTVNLFDCLRGQRIVVRDSENKASVLTGLPAFDTTHGLVWLFRSNSPEFAFAQYEGAARPVLQAIDLAEGKTLFRNWQLFEQWFVPTRDIEALRPRLSRNGNWLAARYLVNNRVGEVLNIFEVSLEKGMHLSGRNVALSGHLRQVTEDGSRFIALLPAGVGVFQLLRREAAAGQEKAQPHESPAIAEVPHDRDGTQVAAVSGDGTLRASGTARGNFSVFAQTSATRICEFESRYVSGEGGRSCVYAEFSPDSRFLLVWGYSSGGGTWDTEIYDPRRGRLLYPRIGGVSRGVNDADPWAVRRVTTDSRAVELLNGQVMTLRFAASPMPPKFADLAEGLIGARIDAHNVYQVFGQPGAPPCATADSLKALADELESGSDWTKFAQQRLSSIR